MQATCKYNIISAKADSDRCSLISINKIYKITINNYILQNNTGENESKMETEIKRSKETLLDQNGQYPAWMNQRQAKRLRAARKAKKKGAPIKTRRSKKLAW